MRHLALSSALTLGLASLTGCATTGAAPSPQAPEAPEPTRSTPDTREVTPSRLAKGASKIDADAEAYAQRLAQAIEASKSPADPPKDVPAKPAASAPGKVEWIDEQDLKMADPPRAARVEPPKVEAVKPAAPEKTQPEPAPVKTVEAVKPAEGAKPQAAAEGGRDALMRLIAERVKDSHDPAAAKALSLAGLALIDPTFKLDEKELAAMPPTQRELVKQFHELFASLGQQVTNGHTIDRAVLADRLNAIIGEQPLAIRAAKLCDRVRGFGVYEELPGDTFLAGREHPLVVYVELDHFKSVKSGATHQVKLTQELILFNEADGLAVWRQPEEQIVDESRNQRRDFYVVQPTRLPARLGVGKYVLKVRVRDLQGGTRDEVSVPINVVADPSLVKPDAKRSEAKPG